MAVNDQTPGKPDGARIAPLSEATGQAAPFFWREAAERHAAFRLSQIGAEKKAPKRGFYGWGRKARDERLTPGRSA